MSERGVSRQGFLRLGGALGGALAAAGVMPVAHASPFGPVAAERGTGGPLLADGNFPIGVFWPPPPLQTTVERWQEMADAGFTFVHSNNYLYADWQIQKWALGIADQVGLKVLVDDGDVRWLTHQFTINDAGGAFTLTRAEAEAKLREVITRYGGSDFMAISGGSLLFNGGTGAGSIGWVKAGTDWTDYTLRLGLAPRATAAGGAAQAGWAFRVQDEGNAYVWLVNNIGGGGHLTRAVFVNGNPTVTTATLPMAILPDTRYEIEMRVVGSTFTTLIDGQEVDTFTDTTFASGTVGLRQAGTESAWFDDISVTATDGTVLFSEDFSGTLAAWRVPGGGGNNSFAGLHVFDEPGDGGLPNLRIVLDIIRGIDPECMPYVNQLPGFDYRAVVRVLDPEVLSFDRYPILASGEDGGYFANWAAVRAAALPTGIPTWAYIQSVGYTAHAVPTKDDLYWQVNVSLAYGCTGIQYFTYWTPDPARGENFTTALITVEGERTPLYDYTKEVNTTYLQAIGKQLLPLTSTAVQGANLGSAVDGLTPWAADGDITEATGGAVILGRFTSDDGSRYVLVVNYSRHKAVKVKLRCGSAVKMSQTYTPATDTWEDSGRGRIPVELGAGRAVLIRLT